jgi:hypothetical protein
MARGKVTLPYLVLRSQDVRTEPVDGWTLVGAAANASPILLRDGDVVESWDGLSELALRRTFRIPVDAAARLGLPPESTRFSLVITAITAGGLLREVLFAQDFGAELQVLNVTVLPKSARLVKELCLASHLVITAAAAVENPLAPAIAGARIWEDSFRFQLEGGRGRIPMETLSFRAAFQGQGFEDALFHIEVAPYPELDVEETVRVYLNSDNRSFVEAAELRDPAASALLWNGVIRRLIASVIMDDTLADDEAYPEGSMGANLARWLRQAFPAMKLPTIKALAVSTPSAFEAMLDSWTGLGRDAFQSTGRV